MSRIVLSAPKLNPTTAACEFQQFPSKWIFILFSKVLWYLIQWQQNRGNFPGHLILLKLSQKCLKDEN